MSKTPHPSNPISLFPLLRQKSKNNHLPRVAKSLESLISRCEYTHSELAQTSTRMLGHIRTVSENWTGAKQSIVESNNKFNTYEHFKLEKERLRTRMEILKKQKADEKKEIVKYILDPAWKENRELKRSNEIPKKVFINYGLTLKSVQDEELAHLLAKNKREFGQPFDSDIKLLSRRRRRINKA